MKYGDKGASLAISVLASTFHNRIQDKGGNIVGSYNGGKVTAWLVEAPGSGSLLPSEQVSDAIR